MAHARWGNVRITLENKMREMMENFLERLCLIVALTAFMFARASVNDQAVAQVDNSVETSAATIEGKIESISVFKNGLAVVRERFQVDAPGMYCVDAVGSALHGTFFVQSDAEIVVTAAKNETLVPFSELKSFDWVKDLEGKWVLITLADSKEPFKARPIPTPNEDPDETPDSPVYWNMTGVSGNTVKNGVFLERENGEVLWLANPNDVKAVAIPDGLPKNFKRFKQNVVFDVKKMPNNGKNAAIVLSYLTSGMAWAPQYRVELKDEKTLDIVQTAVLINDWRDLKDVNVVLCSGFPSVAMSNVLSPMDVNVKLAAFLSSLGNSGKDSSLLQSQAAYASNARVDFARDEAKMNVVSEAGVQDGLDIHFQPLPGLCSIKKGERTLYTLAKAQTPYRNVARWNILDVREPSGRAVERVAGTISELNAQDERYGQTTSGEEIFGSSTLYRQPYDVVSFVNPFDEPLTTGPAAIYNGDDKFIAQNSIFWTNPKEETQLQITKALSIRVKSIENEREIINDAEDQNNAQLVQIQSFKSLNALRSDMWGRNVMYAHNYYRVAVMDAEITLTNTRDSVQNVRIGRQFSGALIPDSLQGFEKDPKFVKLGVASGQNQSVNSRNELQYEFTMQPNETKTFKFSYQILILQ